MVVARPAAWAAGASTATSSTARQAIRARDQEITLPVSDYPAGSDPAGETWRFVVTAGGQAMETEIESGD